MDLTGSRKGATSASDLLIWKGAGAMVTYADLFQLVIMLCAVITLAVIFTRKK